MKGLKIWCIVFALFLVCACSPEVVRNTHLEYRTLHDVQVDSFWRDRFRIIYMRGDTVRVVDSVIVNQLRIRYQHDTLHVLDSIPVPYPVDKFIEVDKPLSAWQRFRIGAFWWLLALVLFAYRKQLFAILKKAFGHY
jgi:hypothetical protein